MTSQEFKQQLTSVTPEIPEHFHNRMEMTLENIASQEVHMKESTQRAIRTTRRFSTRTVVLAFALAIMVCAVAWAAGHWNLFEQLSFMTGNGVPKLADTLMQSNLYQETVNNVEITVREAGYDGRTLLVQYSYRMLDVDESFGITAKEVYGDHLPEGMSADTILEGLHEEALEALNDHQVGWNFDQLWFNGVGMDMPNNSGGVYQGTAVPGEILYTEYWRLDNEGVTLSGPTQITLPIGERVSPEERKALFDRETKMYTLPDKGVLTFTYDAKDIQSQVRTITNDAVTIIPDLVTVKVREAVFTPLMTYITLDLKVDPDAMTAFVAENGEGAVDEDGNLLWAYGGMDVFDSWLCSLELVDGEGRLVFPDHFGQNGYGNEWAEFLYPYLDTIPDALYLAPIENDVAEMKQAVPIITSNR